MARRNSIVDYRQDSTYFYEPSPQPLTFAGLGWTQRILTYGHILQNNRTGRVGNDKQIQRFAHSTINTGPLIGWKAERMSRYGSGAKGNGRYVR